MAKNKLFDSAKTLTVPVPANTKSGDPVVYGQRPGVALTDRAADGTATVQFDGVFTLSVKGVDASANAAGAEGDVVYYSSGDTPKLNLKNTGVRFGYLKAAVNSGATSSIGVILGY